MFEEKIKMRVAFATSYKNPDLTSDDKLALPALKELGIEVSAAIWDNPLVEWTSFDAVVIRSTWDYREKAEQFTAWLRTLESRKVRALNPPESIQWNLRKTYLRELEQRGIPIVPTQWIDHPEIGTEAVVKPVLSAGGYQTYRVQMPLMIQPFLSEILTEGEWGFLFFGNEFSHAVLKRGTPGEFRVQEAYGGKTEKRDVPANWIAAARRVLDCVPRKLLYARVDMIRRDETLLLGELEIFEPCLYFACDPQSPQRFAQALALAIGTGS